MGSMMELAPPGFYLSHPGSGKIFEFIDVVTFTTLYGSSPNVQPLLGMTAPFVSEGSGNGQQWLVEATLNRVHAFQRDAEEGTSARTGGTPYGDLLDMYDLIERNGPTPLLVLHRPQMDDTIVALAGFDSSVSLQESVRSKTGDGPEERLPTVIPISMQLIERRTYKVVVN